MANPGALDSSLMAGRTGQRGHIEKHGTRFRAVVYAGRDPLTGKKRYLKKTSDTERQAQVELTKLLHQVDEQRQPRSGITVSQLIDKWFEVQEHEESTRRTYVGLVKNYMAPVFGSMRAAKLDAELLETFYARLRKFRKLCDGKKSRTTHDCEPLSNSSVRQIHAILRGSLDRGVRWTYFAVNAAKLVSPSRAKKSTPDPPSAEEVAAILNEAWRDPHWGLLLWLVMVTGCRRGELCAVRWSDVDLDRKKIALERSVTRSNQSPTGLKEKRPKVAAYRHPDPAAGRELMVKLIESLSAGVPRPLVEIAKLGRTLSKRAADVLAYFDRPGTSNGPTEAINGRLEHLRGSALGFRNLTNYIARSLLETGGFRPDYTLHW